MLKVVIRGRVFPEHGFSIQNHPKMPFQDSNGDAIVFGMHIDNGAITIECEMEKFESSPQETYFLYVRAMDFASAAINIAALAFGEGRTFILETVTDQHGKTWNFRTRSEELARLFTLAKPNTPDFELFIQIVISRPLLNYAIRDLTQALVVPRLAAINYARAIETIRHLIAPNANKKQGWKILRDNLNVSEDYLKLITDQSISHRHGEHAPISNWNQAEIELRAWTIMNRYLHYTRKLHQLSLADFPLLTG
jgi:hypothetical protein